MSEESFPVGIVGPSVSLPCSAEPPDHLTVRRVGYPGLENAAVAITTLVEEPDFAVTDGEDDEVFVATIVLTPSDARRLIAALLHMADEADGNFTTIMPWKEWEQDD